MSYQFFVSFQFSPLFPSPLCNFVVQAQRSTPFEREKRLLVIAFYLSGKGWLAFMEETIGVDGINVCYEVEG
ncbi:MAG TPA: hypothetical protein VLT35_03625, partial [Methanocella sp.]|nr:hypothetical protein [Methanocella sp.]